MRGPVTVLLILLLGFVCAGILLALAPHRPPKFDPGSKVTPPGGTAPNSAPDSPKPNTNWNPGKTDSSGDAQPFSSNPEQPLGSVDKKANWYMFRGNPELLGMAEGALPAKPVKRWVFHTESGVTGSPAIANGVVYFGSMDDRVYAVNLADGKEIWRFETENGIQSSPLVLKDTVYIGSSDHFLYALNAATGKLKWKFETGEKILGAPNWTESADGKSTWILIGSYDNSMHCVEADTGKEVWSFQTGNFINGSPAVSKGQTVFGGCDGVLHVIAVKDGSETNGIHVGSYIAGSAALSNGCAYFGHYGNRFVCVDLEKGIEAWSYGENDFPFFSSPAVTKDRVIFGGRDKNVHCVDRTTGKKVWVYSTQQKVDSSPVVCGDKVVVGSDDGSLYILNLADGTKAWSYELGRSITSSPAVGGGLIVVGSDDGDVYCFGASN